MTITRRRWRAVAARKGSGAARRIDLRRLRTASPVVEIGRVQHEPRPAAAIEISERSAPIKAGIEPCGKAGQIIDAAISAQQVVGRVAGTQRRFRIPVEKVHEGRQDEAREHDQQALN